MEDSDQDFAQHFVSMLTADLRLGILAEQILMFVVSKLVAELEAGGIPDGKTVSVSSSELCRATGKVIPFPERQICTAMRQLAEAIVEKRRGSSILRMELVERYESLRMDDEPELFVTLSKSVIESIKQDWKGRRTPDRPSILRPT